MIIKDKLTTLKEYLNQKYPMTFYLENEGRYTVMVQDWPFTLI